MAERAIFLDRDNTIIANDGYLGDPAKVRLMPGAATAIAALRRLDYRVIVVSNQSGVARGMFDENAVEAVNQEMCKQLREQAGAHIDASYYCPFHPDAIKPEYKQDHPWRKPQPGMLLQAAEDFSLDLRQSWMVGDQPRDVAAGASAGCRTILVRQMENPAPDADPLGTAVTPNFIVKSLADAARVVAREGFNQLRESPPTPLAAPVEPPEPAAPTANANADVAVQAPAPLPVHPPAEPPAAAAPPAEHLATIEQIVSRISPNGPNKAVEGLRPVLEDILQELRRRNREQQIPEFSLGRMTAAIVQAFVPFFLFMAAWDAIAAAEVKNTGALWFWFTRTTGQLTALMWLLAAVVFQVFVMALYYNSKK